MTTHPPTWETAAHLTVPRRFEDPISIALSELMGTLQPGDKLPNEREIASELGVSRNALRDRIRLMEAIGLLSRKQGSGTYVEKDFNSDGLAFALELLVDSGQLKLIDLHGVRVGLERQAAILCAGGAATEEAIAAMREAITLQAELYDDIPALNEADVVFHRMLIQSANNPALAFFGDALYGAMARAASLGNANWHAHRVGKKLIVAIHEDIVDAIAQRDPRAASEAVDSLFALHSRVVSGTI